MSYPTQRLSVACPNCQQPVTINVQQVIDVGEDPTLRDRLLRGRLNVLDCPHCGVKGPMAVPLVYHDPEKPLFLAYLPNEMQMTMAQEEREIGRLANLVLNHTAPEQRKAYLITPTRVMSFNALIEKILEAEGVDIEEVRAQQASLNLIIQLAGLVDSPDKLSASLKEHGATIDSDFAMLVSALAAQSEAEGDEESAKRFAVIRDAIRDTLHIEAATPPQWSAEEQYDELIDLLLEADDEQFEAWVAANRPYLDYQFFVHLTARADKGGPDEKEELLALRKRMVSLIDAMDEEAKRSMQAASRLFQALLESDDPAALIEERAEEIDPAFFYVLSANIERAEQEKREDVVTVLNQLYQLAMGALESRMEPELRLVNQLLRTPSGPERDVLLESAVGAHGAPSIIRTIESLALQLEDQQQSDPRLIDMLYGLADKVRATPSSDTPAASTRDDVEPQKSAASSGVLIPGQTPQRGKDEPPPTIVLPK